MPDFEALIRHQQLKQPKTNQRLKVVDSPNFEEEKKEETIIRKSGLLVNFFWRFYRFCNWNFINTISLYK